MADKLKSNLAAQLKKVSASDLVDVVLELHPQADPADAGPAARAAQSAPRSRAEKIAAKKSAFDRSVAGVEEAVRKAGGEITGLAWVNQTVRARLPAAGVEQLCRHERVAAVDAPGRLTAEGG